MSGAMSDAGEVSSGTCVRRRDTSGTCLAVGCQAVLATLSKYCQQRRLCPAHLKASCLKRKNHGDQLWRFCQQCGKLEHITAFDGDKRSCRVRLARRRAVSFRVPSTSSTDHGGAYTSAVTDTAGSHGADMRAGPRRSVSHASLEQLLLQQHHHHQELLQPHVQQQQLLLQQVHVLQQDVGDAGLQERLHAVQAQLAGVQQQLMLLHKRQQAETELLALQQQYDQLDLELQHQHQLLLGRQHQQLSPAASSDAYAGPGMLAPTLSAPLAPAHAAAAEPAPQWPASRMVRFQMEPAELEASGSLPSGSAAATSAYDHSAPLQQLPLAAPPSAGAASAPLPLASAASLQAAAAAAAATGGRGCAGQDEYAALIGDLQRNWEEVLLQDMEQDAELDKMLAGMQPQQQQALAPGPVAGGAFRASCDTSSDSSCSDPDMTHAGSWPYLSSAQPEQQQAPARASPFALTSAAHTAPLPVGPFTVLPGAADNSCPLPESVPQCGGAPGLGADDLAAHAGPFTFGQPGEVEHSRSFGRRSLEHFAGYLESALMDAGTQGPRSRSVPPVASAAAAAAAFAEAGGACWMDV